ncbi:hypothetical protein AF335_27955 [Streptomyces eurocidicus]|uniref:Uncharacterized protein n=1 Tax=Streptomyces eurocidicus TaxID=66423 RepID=A0A2N8NPE3_STREU|nr:hypothetical protein [Streptomyces eurocidicus]MBB5119646.1 hypothetical protein [Streptomyces eurocidicus]MBF6050675.1 hypothetical protein [Streptomyces eurocidicus]PNE30641.1 hypothetical protein AF335_27955 [Streptomyces eurocidicus]
MRHEDRHEDEDDRPPLFTRRRYGSRWVYNDRNPGGLALIVIAPVVAVGVLLLLSYGSPR